MKISKKQIQKNTDDLFARFDDEKVKAAATPLGKSSAVRDCAIESARKSEWYVCFGILQIPAMRAIYDGIRIAERLDQRVNEIRRHVIDTVGVEVKA